MKTLKTFFAASLLLVGLSFTACSDDDDPQPETPTPENPIEQVPGNPIELPEAGPF